MTHRDRLPFLASATVAAACLHPGTAPVAALGAGIALKAAFGARTPAFSARFDRLLLQGSVVLLGFGMDLRAVVVAGVHGMGLSLLLLALTFGLGWIASRLFGLDRQASLLVSAGTAICGGSAIAAVATSIEAERESIGVAMGVVFLLNAAALVLFPAIGHLLHMGPAVFGTWAGLAIHDVSSVVGAATSFDPSSLPAAVATKMGRTLWILPIGLLAAWANRRNGGVSGGKAAPPWFLLGFLAAAAAGALAPALAFQVPRLRIAAHAGFDLALALIGLRVDWGRIRRGGAPLLLQGGLQWIAVAAISLLAVRPS